MRPRLAWVLVGLVLGAAGGAVVAFVLNTQCNDLGELAVGCA